MYHTTAFLYDETAAFEELEMVCSDLQAIFSCYGLKPPGLLGDLGTGTGLMAILLAKQGWQVYGIDLTPAMLEMAQQKAAHLPPEIRARLTWRQGDITSFTLPDPLQLDGAICLCNTVNHIVEWPQVEGFIRSAFQALKPGGILVLDSDTEETFRGFFHHPPTVVWDNGVHQMIRACQFDDNTGRANHVAVLSRYQADGTLQPISEERMTLQYHPEPKLANAFMAAGFKIRNLVRYNPNPVLYGDNLDAFTPKILWTLQKPLNPVQP